MKVEARTHLPDGRMYSDWTGVKGQDCFRNTSVCGFEYVFCLFWSRRISDGALNLLSLPTGDNGCTFGWLEHGNLGDISGLLWRL